MIMLPFSELLFSHKFDPQLAMLADQHYSRQTPGSPQFMPPGRTMVIRNAEGTLLFGWLHQQYRDDGQRGYCCSIFHNQSSRRSSDVILECERRVFEQWGDDRVFTYVDPARVSSPNPGYCFKCAGWQFGLRTESGLHLLAKEARS